VSSQSSGGERGNNPPGAHPGHRDDRQKPLHCSPTPQTTCQPTPWRLITSWFWSCPFPRWQQYQLRGTDDQFRIAARINNRQVGRVNSFFDHYLPLYPASNDPNLPGGSEPAEPPIGDNILIFDGSLDATLNYSGHPGFDFSTFERMQPTTPVFAAADGEIFLVGKHSSGALFVKIKHTVPGVGDFLTIYWHLHPDEFFDAMLGREGQPISAGTRIGTMGNTGFSTGHHLHFEVR
jgi:murein DD-endopeptidase MepM/ murein hydrolase activator NlpD